MSTRTTFKRGFIIYWSTIVFSLLFLYFGYQAVASKANLFQSQNSTIVEQAIVEKIIDKVSEPLQMGEKTLDRTTIYFKAQITKGEKAGQTVIAQQLHDPLYSFSTPEIAPGNKILICQIYKGNSSDEEIWALQEYVRTDALLVLLIFFLLCILFFGGQKGLNTIISLFFTCLAIFVIFVPSILAGYNIYLSMLVVSAFIIIITLILVNGANAKSFSAAIGCFGGIAVAGLLIIIMDNFLHLTGMVNEESLHLYRLRPDNPISIKAVMFSSIIIGALGAILDVAVSIASALSEIHEKSQETNFANLFKSGMTIGRDILGTMANTLILVYIGSSLSLILLLLVYSNSIIELLNRELIVIEILQTLIGTTGLLFAVPTTALCFAYMVKKKLV